MAAVSLPSREAWIEIFVSPASLSVWQSRFPRGKRGLKSEEEGNSETTEGSLPSREAWIEILMPAFLFVIASVASLAGSVD